MDKKDRFRLFLELLNNGTPATSFEHARSLLNDSLNSVEDLYSGVPFDPSRWRTDGRMYPPADDYEVESSSDRVRRFRTRGHVVDIGDNGAIRILRVGSDDPVIDKPGSDGVTVTMLVT